MTKYGFYALAVLLCGLTLTTARADDLCPDNANDMAVNDMTGLQFDIGRLNLCLQRAKLLEQIDQTVKKRELMRQEPLGMPLGSSGKAASLVATGDVAPFGTIPALNAALPPLPKDESALPRMASVTPKTIPQAVAATPAATPAADDVNWKIQRIWGQGEGMQAQLKRNGVIANVRKNDVLPTGEKVTDLSARGVTINSGAMHKALMWSDEAKMGVTGASRAPADAVGYAP